MGGSDFGSRLKVVVDQAGGPERFAQLSGIPARMIYKYLTNQADPSRERTVTLAYTGGVSVGWLAAGEELGPPDNERAELPTDYVALPRYDVQAAAGAGQLVESEQVVDWIHFQRDWIRRTLGVSPAQLTIIEAVGDSMAPTIDDGDLLLVDVGDPKLRGDGIYVIAVDDALLVKRLAIKLAGGLVISSDNPRYHTTSQEIGREDLNRVRIVGRVVWVGGRM